MSTGLEVLECFQSTSMDLWCIQGTIASNYKTHNFSMLGLLIIELSMHIKNTHLINTLVFLE